MYTFAACSARALFGYRPKTLSLPYDLLMLCPDGPLCGASMATGLVLERLHLELVCRGRARSWVSRRVGVGVGSLANHTGDFGSARAVESARSSRRTRRGAKCEDDAGPTTFQLFHTAALARARATTGARSARQHAQFPFPGVRRPRSPSARAPRALAVETFVPPSASALSFVFAVVFISCPLPDPKGRSRDPTSTAASPLLRPTPTAPSRRAGEARVPRPPPAAARSPRSRISAAPSAGTPRRRYRAANAASAANATNRAPQVTPPDPPSPPPPGRRPPPPPPARRRRRLQQHQHATVGVRRGVHHLHTRRRRDRRAASGSFGVSRDTHRVSLARVAAPA